MKNSRPKARKVRLPHYSYQPIKAELEEDHRVDATFEEIVAACLRPVEITYVKPSRTRRKA